MRLEREVENNLGRRRGTRWEGQRGEGEKDSRDAPANGEGVRGLEPCATVREGAPTAIDRNSMLCTPYTPASLSPSPFERVLSEERQIEGFACVGREREVFLSNLHEQGTREIR